MGLLSKAVKVATALRRSSRESTSLERGDDCRVQIKLRKSEFIVMAKFYYRGYTSYRGFFRYVFMGKAKKIIEVADKVKVQIAKECEKDDIMVRFYFKENTHYIDIPADVFTSKKNMTISMRKSTLWDRGNIQRILKLYPEFKDVDTTMISEGDIVGLLSGE